MSIRIFDQALQGQHGGLRNGAMSHSKHCSLMSLLVAVAEQQCRKPRAEQGSAAFSNRVLTDCCLTQLQQAASDSVVPGQTCAGSTPLPRTLLTAVVSSWPWA